MNDIITTVRFDELFEKKKRKKNEALIDQIKNGILALRKAEDPARIGQLKKGKYKGTYGYRVNKSSRILYQVEWGRQGCTVHLLRVCDHKNVYGKD